MDPTIDAMKRNTYGSINSLKSFNNEECEHKSGTMVPCSILIPLVLFAILVGHIATLGYFKVSSSQSNIGTKHITMNDISKAQEYAKQQFKAELLEPCKKAEEFYNKTTMSSTNFDHNSAPPRPPQDGCVATIMLLRHCEAGVAREHCGYMGNLRSQYIATLFGNADERWPEPSYLYAMAAGERHNDLVKNWREVETVEPLSKKVNVEIDESYGFPEKKSFVKHLYKQLRSGKMCGKVAVISWKHHDIPHFTHSLGCGPKNGCPMTFDEDDYESIWQLTYSYHKEKYAPYVEEDKTLNRVKNHKPWGLYPQWWIYGSIQTEGFDPLAFAKMNGSDRV